MSDDWSLPCGCTYRPGLVLPVYECLQHLLDDDLPHSFHTLAERKKNIKPRCVATLVVMGKVEQCKMPKHGTTYGHVAHSGVTWNDEHPLPHTKDEPEMKSKSIGNAAIIKALNYLIGKSYLLEAGVDTLTDEEYQLLEDVAKWYDETGRTLVEMRRNDPTKIARHEYVWTGRSPDTCAVTSPDGSSAWCGQGEDHPIHG